MVVSSCQSGLSLAEGNEMHPAGRVDLRTSMTIEPTRRPRAMPQYSWVSLLADSVAPVTKSR